MARKITVEDRVKELWDQKDQIRFKKPDEKVEVRVDVLTLLICAWVTGARSPKSGDWWQAPPTRKFTGLELDDDIPF